ncbi:MAG: ABC transporter substrate-binding protein [Proteobacteria bacterium]|nr:ABC transporter substrate-binding protein [Pseudomonadota bacterium]
MLHRRTVLGAAAAALAAPAFHAHAAQTPGITDTEIKFGNTYPYSGPASGYATNAKAEAAYFRMLNEQGGINGRKLNFISYDDAASPPKTVEQTRRLIEQDGVAFLFNPLGTASNTAIVKYVNMKKVPHLFLATGADQWGLYKEHPWTIGWQPSYRTEAQIYGKYIQKTKPDAKIGIIYQNDDFGKDYIAGLQDVIGPEAMKSVRTVSYELTDPTVDSQLVSLKAAGVDTLIAAASIKFGALVIRKVSDLDWKPLYLQSNVSTSVAGVMIPAGPERGVGIISSAYLKDPTDPAWVNDPDMVAWRAFMAKYYPEGDLNDVGNVYGYGLAKTMEHVLRACGNDLSRENIMKQATSMDHVRNPILLPGITLATSDTNYRPIRQLQLIKWNGKTWDRFGEIIEGANV